MPGASDNGWLTRAFVLAAILAWGAPALADERMEDLSDGEILVSTIPVKDAYYPKIRLEGVVEAPPHVVWQIVRDCEASERVNERVMKSFIVKRIEKDVVCSEKMDLPWPIRDLTSVTRWVFHPGPSKWRKTWTLVEGDFDYTNGSWTLTEFGSPSRTLVVYENHFSPQINVPDWLTKAFLKVGAPGIIKDLRKASTALLEKQKKP